MAAGHSVTALDLLAPEEAKVGRLGPEPFAHPEFGYTWGDVQSLPSVAWYNVVVHLAAQGDVDLGYHSVQRTVSENVLGTVALLETIARGSSWPLLIYASSAHAMEQSADGDRRLSEADELRPSTPYGFSKAAAEMACWTWHRCYGLPVSVMSNGIVAGPGMRREHVLWKWLNAIADNQPVVLEGGAQTRDLTYVDDVLDAWMLAIEAPREKVVGQKFQVSYGVETSVADILYMCFTVTGKEVRVIRRSARPGEIGMRERFDISKAQQVLGYAPKLDPWQTISLTWTYVQQERRRRAAAESVLDPAPPRSPALPRAVAAAPAPARP